MAQLLTGTIEPLDLAGAIGPEHQSSTPSNRMAFRGRGAAGARWRSLVFQIQKLGERGDRFFPAREPSIGWWNGESVSIDELLRQPDQRELMRNRILIECMSHVL
jgi:hypothetical protein